MSSILYYSNYCEFSKRLIPQITKSGNTNDMHFICIDKRIKGENNKTYIILETGQKIIFPETITKVPALLLLNQGYKVLYYDDILRFLKPKEEVLIKQATNNNLEPMAFSLGGGDVVSDQYSFLDQDTSSKGNGGLLQMHSYVNVNQLENPSSISIPTPTDEVQYKGSNKIPQDLTVEQLQQQRENEYNKIAGNVRANPNLPNPHARGY